MSGGPPHHPHNRQVPASNLANTAWNHLQVPNYFPRQPQLAHMSNEHSLLHQPTWHTPTTEALKIHPHTHVLSEMFKNESLFPRDCVDLSLARNGNQNGELPPAPISLSVRDTNKINSLPPSALDIQAVELTKSTSPSGKSLSPAIQSASPNRKSLSPGLKSSSPSLRAVPPYPKTSSPALISTTSNIYSASSSLLSSARNLNQNLVSSSGLKSASPVPKSISPGLKASSPSLKPASPGLKYATTIQGLFPSTTTSDVVKTTQKRSNVRVDSILERLNPTPDKIVAVQENRIEEKLIKPQEVEPLHLEKPVSVIVQPTGFDDNSNSSSINNIPVTSNIKDDDTISTNSNDDSLDSTKSRRKRKPSKTIRVSKDEDKVDETIDTVDTPVKETPIEEKDPISIMGEMLEDSKIPDKEELPSDLEELIPAKTRRKTSSESETIDDIAAMVQEGLKEKEQKQQQHLESSKEELKPESQAVSVIKTKENLTEVLSDSSVPSVSMQPSIITPAAKKANTPFLEVENKLEEMFAGIEDSSEPAKPTALELDDSKTDDPLLKLDDAIATNNENADNKSHELVIKNENTKPETGKELLKSEEVTSNIEESPSITEKKSPVKKTKRKAAITSTPNPAEFTSKKKKVNKASKSKSQPKSGSSKKTVKQKLVGKIDIAKDIYAYDSGSNTSSTKSRGPFIQIKGPRDSPLSVNVVNSSVNDEDGERKLPKTKKFHDDTEYRHKVRSKGLHSSTLSNKYDAQTRDATWICAFCKRGPHASELTGPTLDKKIDPPGDLFGPYFITTQCPEFERRLDDPYDRQFKSRKITKALDAVAAMPTAKSKKSKRKHSDSDGISESESDIYLGITETGNKTYEIWAHEDCLVWSHGTYLIGPKIVGLEAAVWTCCNIPCKSCHLKGANILCFRRGCLNVMHICCARNNDWQFLESNFKAYCPEHRVP